MKSALDLFAELPDDGFGLINCKELNARLRDPEPPYILDIRRKDDWEQSRIADSNHSEWEDVGRLIDAGKLPKNRDVVVVCYVGQSSGQVTGVLRILGFRAYSLLDGINEWKNAGYPVDNSAEVN